jgi:hypothetical protein
MQCEWQVSIFQYPIFLYIFVASAFIYPFQYTNNAYQVILYTTALLCFPKNLKPWQDSNPVLLVPEADAMSTAPRRQWHKLFFH